MPKHGPKGNPHSILDGSTKGLLYVAQKKRSRTPPIRDCADLLVDGWYFALWKDGWYKETSETQGSCKT